MADPIKNFVSIAPTYMGLFMSDFDASKEDAAAVFGNFGHESRGFTALQEEKPLVPGSAGGWGWGMWTADRRRAFEAYAKRNGLDLRSPEANYKWFWNELHGPEGRVLPKLKAAKTLRDKVIVFCDTFERPHPNYKHYDSRLEWAERALAAYNAADDLPDVRPAPEPETPKIIGEVLDEFLEKNGLQEVAIAHRRKE